MLITYCTLTVVRGHHLLQILRPLLKVDTVGMF